jgi:hypothetical protein
VTSNEKKSSWLLAAPLSQVRLNVPYPFTFPEPAVGELVVVSDEKESVNVVAFTWTSAMLESTKVYVGSATNVINAVVEDSRLTQTSPNGPVVPAVSVTFSCEINPHVPAEASGIHAIQTNATRNCRKPIFITRNTPLDFLLMYLTYIENVWQSSQKPVNSVRQSSRDTIA